MKMLEVVKAFGFKRVGQRIREDDMPAAQREVLTKRGYLAPVKPRKRLGETPALPAA